MCFLLKHNFGECMVHVLGLGAETIFEIHVYTLAEGEGRRHLLLSSYNIWVQSTLLITIHRHHWQTLRNTKVTIACQIHSQIWLIWTWLVWIYSTNVAIPNPDIVKWVQISSVRGGAYEFCHEIQAVMYNPNIFNPNKNSLGTNGFGLTKFDCTCTCSLAHAE